MSMFFSEIVVDVLNSYTIPLTTFRCPHAQYCYHTKDSGHTCVPKPSPAKVGTILFINADKDWQLDAPYSAATSKLYQTTIAGETLPPCFCTLPASLIVGF
jgi:hypothetical protein